MNLFHDTKHYKQICLGIVILLKKSQIMKCTDNVFQTMLLEFKYYQILYRAE